MEKKIEFNARMYGKATQQAVLNWQSFQVTARYVASTAKAQNFIYMCPEGAVRVSIEKLPDTSMPEGERE